MTSYFSSLLTNTTSRYDKLRRSLLSDETDGDTEEDSHISRVLRAYYIEKGRQFPTWLPPDLKQHYQPPPTQYGTASTQQQQQSLRPAARRGGGLSDLWNTPQQTDAAPSLRRGASSLRPVAEVGQGTRPEPYGGQPSERLLPSGARTLPSQRAGSYQNRPLRISEDGGRPGLVPAPSSGGTAQDRLKARLWGGARPSSDSSRSSFDRPS